MIRSILLSTFLVVASVGFTADVTPVDVTVSGQDGKVAFKGKTDAKGAFRTREPRSWNYTVLFNSGRLLHGQYTNRRFRGEEENQRGRRRWGEVH